MFCLKLVENPSPSAMHIDSTSFDQPSQSHRPSFPHLGKIPSDGTLDIAVDCSHNFNSRTKSSHLSSISFSKIGFGDTRKDSPEKTAESRGLTYSNGYQPLLHHRRHVIQQKRIYGSRFPSKSLRR